MASKMPTGKKTVPAVNVADAAPAITAPGNAAAFVPTQPTVPVAEAPAALKPPFAAAEAPEPAAVPLPAAIAMPARAQVPVAKKKAVMASPVVQSLVEQIVEPSVIPTEVTPMKEEIMDANTTAPFDNAATSDMADKAMFANSKGGKAIADMNEFGKANIEAIVESNKIAARGIEAMGQDAAEFGRRQLEGATAAFKSMSTVKSPTDFFKLQSDFIRASFDQLVAQTSKNTEAMLKLAGEVAQPVSNRVAVAVEKAKIAA